jgi:hypothetical protein
LRGGLEPYRLVMDHADGSGTSRLLKGSRLELDRVTPEDLARLSTQPARAGH